MAARRPAEDPHAAAVEWMVLLSSGEVSPAESRAHQQWLLADPRHAQAWARVRGALREVVEPVQQVATGEGLQPAAVRTALDRPRRRGTLRGLVGLAVVVGAGFTWQARPDWRADLRTATGERRRMTLADGSELLLDAGSAVDVEFTPALRRLRLHAGQLMVAVAPQRDRPFVVATEAGEVRALGTRFVVSQREARSHVAVLEHRVQVAAGRDTAILEAGQSIGFDRSGLATPRPAASAALSWVNGMVSVDDEPLSVVIEALRPYRPGVIQLSSKAASLRVFGAFPLDSPDRALDSLAEVLPIRVRRYGPWWVSVQPAER